MFDSIRWRIMVSYAIIVLIATLGLALYVSSRTRQARLTDLQSHLLAEARLMADNATPFLEASQGPDIEALNGLAQRWAIVLNKRITFIGADGTVLGESHMDHRDLENQLYREEVQGAIQRGYGTSIRFSEMASYNVMYVAVSVHAGPLVRGIVRVALSLNEIERNVNQLSQNILLAGIFTALITAGVGIYVAGRTTRPIRRLTTVVERMAQGDLTARLLPTTRDEVGKLTRSFNHMADQLRDQLSTLARERSRLSAVLSNMADGVIITNEQSEVLLVNPAASQTLNINVDDAVGRTFAQVVYNHQLIDLWNRCQQTGREQQATVETGTRGTFIQSVITPLSEMEPPRILVILQDLTRVRRLETIRRDFISNISHELRTPLASLRVVVETLKDGAIHDPPVAQRFLTHMESELNALTQMVQELLELSRIESGRVPLKIKPVTLQELIDPSVARLQPQAERMGLSLIVNLSPGLPKVLADAERIHQVLTNLLHNAIKFTLPGGVVTVFAEVKSMSELPKATQESKRITDKMDEDVVVIAVCDTGVGISEEDLPRIFERFYKADRARSGGGTGLGLAIAKHVVQGHRGKIWAESIESVGSTFYFSLRIA